MDDNTLDQLRKQIDELDDELLQVLSRRMQIVAQIGKQKKAHGIKPLDEDRMKNVLQLMLKRARILSLSEKFIEKLYALIHEYSLEIEEKESV